jgi:tetratricopeptide (TPR) repeat protein
MYTWRVVGYYNRAIDAYKRYIDAYPNDYIPHNNIGMIYDGLGKDEAISEFRTSIRLNPDAASAYGNLAFAYVRKNRLDEAKAVLADMAAHKLAGPSYYGTRSIIAFLENDENTMREMLEAVRGKPSEADAINGQAAVAMLRGHHNEYVRLIQEAEQSFQRSGRKEGAAGRLIDRAGVETILGFADEGRRQLNAGLAMADTPDLRISAAFAYALLGDRAAAEKSLALAEKRYATNTLIQALPFAMVRALVEPSTDKALATLESTKPYESIDVGPNMLRGVTYLRAGNGSAAAAEFEKVTRRPYVDPLSILHVYASVCLGRAYALAGDKAKARGAYQDFFALWKDADPDIPLLQKAKAEYAKLGD